LERVRRMQARRWEGALLCEMGLLHHVQDAHEAALEAGQQAAAIANTISDRSLHGLALTVMGHACASLGCYAPARAAYGQGLELREALGEPHLAAETRAGLAALALLEGNSAAARATIAEVLTYIDAQPALDGTKERLRLYLTGAQVLRAAGETEPSMALLATAYQLLRNLAAQISNPAKQCAFLEQVAVHREVVALWEEVHLSA